MNEYIVYIALVLFGVCLGSYAAATVWRLRAQQLLIDKTNKEPYDKKEYGRLKKLLGKKTHEDRSQCLECGYKLRWYDLIPVISWLSLKGRCRQCKHLIGWAEPLMEVSVALFFVVSYVFWPGGFVTGFDVAHFVLWLAAGVIMAMLFMYDFKWFLLPDRLTLLLGVIGAGIVGIVAAETQQIIPTITGALGAIGILGGLYAVLYFASRGRWVGFGDVKLGVALGLLLLSWDLAFLALFLANFIGCLVVIPLLATKKIQRNAHVPFGPLFIIGAVLAWLFGAQIISLYLGAFGI